MHATARQISARSAWHLLVSARNVPEGILRMSSAFELGTSQRRHSATSKHALSAAYTTRCVQHRTRVDERSTQHTNAQNIPTACDCRFTNAQPRAVLHLHHVSSCLLRRRKARRMDLVDNHVKQVVELLNKPRRAQ